MNALVLTLVVKASVLLALAAIANAALRGRVSAASRHLVWTLALAGVLALPAFAAIAPRWEVSIPVASAPAVSAPASTISKHVEDSSCAACDLRTPAVESVPAIGPLLDAASGSVASATPDIGLFARVSALASANQILAVYLAGVLLLGLRLLAGQVSLARLVRQSTEVKDPEWRRQMAECEAEIGLARPVRLLRSLDRSMPMAFGVFRPTVLIPAIADTWDEDRRRAVLLHELAHIARRDCATQILAEIACAAYWMHPGVWWASTRLKAERELACDDRVLKAGTGAREYATHLLELAYSLGGHRSPALVLSMARPRQLEGRMLAVLDAARNRVVPGHRAYALGLAVLTAIVLPLATVEAVPVSMQDSKKAQPPVTTGDEDEDDLIAPLAPLAPSAPLAPRVPLAPRAPLAPAPHPPREAVSIQGVRPPTPPMAPDAPMAPPAPPAPPQEWRDSRRREIQLPGTWDARMTTGDEGRVHLRLSERPYSQSGFSIAMSELQGLPASMFSGSDGSAKFDIRRDAGTITFEGVFRAGVGAGTFDFTPNDTFKAELSRRGFEAPNATDMYLLARGNIGIAYLDELKAQKYEQTTLADLVRASDHGVNLDYLREMGAAGYSVGRIGALIRMRDHGVTPKYVRALAAAGYKNLAAEELVRARDHGVTAQYAATLQAFGYGALPLEALIRARDHGVSEDYIRGMAEAGHVNVPLEKLIRARDHGVGPEYARAMREAGYGAATLEELVTARDHGVSADYVRGMTRLGPERPSLDELASARDHGVTPEFAREWRETGQLPMLSDLVRAKDHGIDAKYVRSLKELGYDRLSVEDLVRLRNHGISASFVKEQNRGAATKLSVDQLVRRFNGNWR